MRKNGKKLPDRRFYIVLLILLIAALAVILGIMIRNYLVQKNAEDIFTQMSSENTEKLTEVQEPETETEMEEPDLWTQLGIEIPEKNPDWDALWEQNADIYAWIYIPNTNVDYPVLQHPSDDTYYLNYNIDGSRGYPGCIYTELANSKDFTDYNTVIYGHNMKNGTMFRTLHYFEDGDFFEENPYFYIYTPDDVLVYWIYGAYPFRDTHLLKGYDTTTEYGFEKYLKDVFDVRDMGAHFRDGVEVTAQNHIVTLSTCISGQSSKRFLVQGVLINDPALTETGRNSDAE